MKRSIPSDASEPTEVEPAHGFHKLVKLAQVEFNKPPLHPNQTILPPVGSAVYLRVGVVSLPRAFRLIDKVIKGLIKRKYEVKAGPIVVIDSIPIRFGLAEEVRMPPVNLQVRDQGTGRFYARPIGLLIFRILTEKPRSWDQRTTWKIEETRMKPLEQKIDLCLQSLEDFAVKARLYLDNEQKRRDAFPVELAYWRSREDGRLARNEEIKNESKKFDELFRKAEDLKKSRVIRDFIAASQADYFSKHGEILPDTEFAMWVSWATKQADRLDPFVQTAPSLLDEKINEVPYDKPWYWGDKDPEGYFK